MAIDKEVLDQLLAGRDPQELFAKDGLIDELKKALSERMLLAELDDHLASEAEAGGDNRRNGSSKKTMLTGSSKVTLDIPRDRSGTFDPKLIAKYQRRFPDFDTKIISMYARGMTVREIRGQGAGISNAGAKSTGTLPMCSNALIHRSSFGRTFRISGRTCRAIFRPGQSSGRQRNQAPLPLLHASHERHDCTNNFRVTTAAEWQLYRRDGPLPDTNKAGDKSWMT
ncbi:Transposase, Mutator family [Sphingopyxis flava]|uniref:Mutator family transposase n=1 Tax=Sphingopyxis flava TaxID=1507287 RepID=A0A1T5G070_9SPHN|nr:Transposase, Mutator family [Sphingopyxis flava]